MSQHPALPYLRNSEKGKIVTAAEAVRLISRDGDTVATGGFVGIGFAEENRAGAWKEPFISPKRRRCAVQPKASRTI